LRLNGGNGRNFSPAPPQKWLDARRKADEARRKGGGDEIYTRRPESGVLLLCHTPRPVQRNWATQIVKGGSHLTHPRHEFHTGLSTFLWETRNRVVLASNWEINQLVKVLPKWFCKLNFCLISSQLKAFLILAPMQPFLISQWVYTLVASYGQKFLFLWQISLKKCYAK
jgi:hypothetical protein